MKFNKTTLKNGLRIITVPITDHPSVTVLVMAETGSKYEDKQTNGLSHFLEHMLFKGTPRRPQATDVSHELDSIGAQYNAFTSNEYTGYYVKTAPHQLPISLDILSDIYLNPLFKKEEMEKEKGVIVEEIRMYNDLPQRIVGDVFMDLVYGDQPAGWKVIGSEDNVRSFSREQLVTYKDCHYVAESTIVIVAGSFDETKIVDHISAAFAAIPTTKKSTKLAVVESQSAPAIKTFYKETDQTHLIMGVRSFAITDPRSPIINVLATVLGKGMSSRLFAKMRDQLGICYYVQADQDAYTDHGIFEISAGVDNSRVKEAIVGILEECVRLKNELVSPAELKKVKDFIAGNTLLGLETSDARGEFCAYQEILKGKIELPDEMMAKIQAVTAEEVQALARELFVDTHLNMAIVGRFKDGAQFEDYFKFS
ncbi:MAG TPA: pitrilysin family protein [Candidatus Paceibacterota bacterium]|jgi:predicted Zn-dependent peptidase|nr:pitrilysin family protein [Candidatus Paceibacterota bacterium]